MRARKTLSWMLRAILFFCLLFCSGCGTMKSGRGWGENAVSRFSASRTTHAALNALLDIQTLLPAAGAAIFAIGDFDEKASEWANKKHPVFGSEQTAIDYGDALKYALLGETFLTALATPSGDEPKAWAVAKAKGIAVELAALGINEGFTVFLKKTVDRTRPDGSDNESFPSGHASGAFTNSTLSNRNLNSIPVHPGLKTSLKITNLLLATSVAWSRVEAGKHYPSDVLAGAALGHFIAAFMYDAFLGVSDQQMFQFVIIPMKKGAVAGIGFRF